jgi:glycolate oxidase FAD binding subunit
VTRHLLNPRDEADIAEIIATHPGSLEVIGGGSKRGIGRPIAADGLDVSALAGIIAYEPDELVLTARAATPLASVVRALDERRQRLAFEPPDFGPLLGAAGTATIGGILAANLSGSRRVTAGAARDHFLGFRAVTGRGERFKGGGRVVKNVTGYDLPKVLAGSWGTLAVLTEVSIRVHPAPEHERTLLIPLAEVAGAVAAMGTALGSACDVSAAAFLPGRGVGLRLEGFEPSVRARSDMLLGALAPSGAEWLEVEASQSWWRAMGAAASLGDAPIVWRLSVPPHDAPRVIDELRPERFLLDWGGGLIWIGCATADAERIRGALRGGHATLIKAPEAVRAATAVFQPPPAPLGALVARLKAAFDPADRLNPGRMN